MRGFFSRFSTNAGAKSAASELIERVIAEERDRSILSISRVRALFAVLNALVVVPVAEVEGYTQTWPSRVGAAVYAVCALVLFAVVWKWPKTRGVAAWAPAFLDVPLVGAFEFLQTRYAVVAGIGAPSSIAMLLGFVLLSSVALSRRIVMLVTPVSLAFMWAILSASQTPIAVRLNVMVVTTAFAGLGLVLVGKIRTLVQSSRQKDLLGKYILGERLGAGGMAEVFRAVYSPEGGFERTVAVKRILPSWAGNADLVALFRREAELGARLAHPNVVQVYDFGSDGETFFLAMEFVDGITLSALLRELALRGRTLPIPALLWLTQELATALDYVHSRTDSTGAPLNLVHRDFNPPNILISRVGEVKVADFGIARSADRPSLTAPGMMRGKLAYAAPEQVTEGPLDGRTDLFALGLTLYEAATCKRLLSQSAEVELLRVLLEGQAESPAELRPDLPPAFCEVVRALLARAPGERPPTGAEVLRRLSDGERRLAAQGRAQLTELVTGVAQPVAPPRAAEVDTVTRPT